MTRKSCTRQAPFEAPWDGFTRLTATTIVYAIPLRSCPPTALHPPSFLPDSLPHTSARPLRHLRRVLRPLRRRRYSPPHNHHPRRRARSPLSAHPQSRRSLGQGDTGRRHQARPSRLLRRLLVRRRPGRQAAQDSQGLPPGQGYDCHLQWGPWGHARRAQHVV